jgi:hypothetical protein
MFVRPNIDPGPRALDKFILRGDLPVVNLPSNAPFLTAPNIIPRCSGVGPADLQPPSGYRRIGEFQSDEERKAEQLRLQPSSSLGRSKAVPCRSSLLRTTA